MARQTQILNGYYDPELEQMLLRQALLKRARPRNAFKPEFDWKGVVWKTVIFEIVFIILKFAYGAYVASELLKKHPEMIVPEYYSQFPLQIMASPIYMLVQSLYPTVTGQPLEQKRTETLAEIGIPSILDDMFGKYCYIIMALIPIVIILFEFMKIQKERKTWTR